MHNKYLHQPKILSGPEVEMFQYTGIVITLVVYGILILPIIFVFSYISMWNNDFVCLIVYKSMVEAIKMDG